MTGNQPTNLSPSACFVVEREPGKGYQVASAEGDYAAEWKGRALDLLDALGQPDPKGPAEYFRWVGPITPSGEYVGVAVKLMPNGEARYHQAWFQVPKRTHRYARSIGSVIVVLLLVFAAGAFAGRSLGVPDRQTAPAPVAHEAGSPGNSKPVPPVKDAPPDVRTTKLKNELASSRDVCTRLKGYLNQKGLAAVLSNTVITQRNSVTLIADRLIEPPPKERVVDLSNLEVAKVVRLLETLDEWTANPKAAPKSEGR